MSQTLSAPARMGFQTRVVMALLITASLPLLTAMVLANTVIQRASGAAFQEEVGQHLERSLTVYGDLVEAMKTAMRHEGAAIAAHPAVVMGVDAADARGDTEPLRAALEGIAGAHPNLLTAELLAADGSVALRVERERPLEPAGERPFTVRVPTSTEQPASVLELTFAADKRRIDELESAQRFTRAWRGQADAYGGEAARSGYLAPFAVLFAITLALAVIVGILAVRPVIQRIHHLAEATRPVADGDLSVRVQDDGKDEIAYLAYAFNRMLDQLGRSRARIEFLKRMGEWQQMARRLAHEIKNPLTPILLAVEECHRRYQGDDPAFRKMLDTTKDIVVEEVESLRRLVSEFANFARLPRAALAEGDLGAFLREQQPRLLREELADDEDVELTFEIEEGELPVALDRTMMYRVLSNLVANAIQAAKADHDGARVRVRAVADEDSYILEVEDDGPGVPPQLGVSVFDPYVTTKQDGSGLGLTIVKKIVLDHGGHIDVDTSPLGGARFRVSLPPLGSEESFAALARSEAPIRSFRA